MEEFNLQLNEWTKLTQIIDFKSSKFQADKLIENSDGQVVGTLTLDLDRMKKDEIKNYFTQIKNKNLGLQHKIDHLYFLSPSEYETSQNGFVPTDSFMARAHNQREYLKEQKNFRRLNALNDQDLATQLLKDKKYFTDIEYALIVPEIELSTMHTQIPEYIVLLNGFGKTFFSNLAEVEDNSMSFEDFLLVNKPIEEILYDVESQDQIYDHLGAVSVGLNYYVLGQCYLQVLDLKHLRGLKEQ